VVWFGVLGLDRCHFDILVNQSLENKYQNAKTFYFIILRTKLMSSTLDTVLTVLDTWRWLLLLKK
jgi:hypothetical protein